MNKKDWDDSILKRPGTVFGDIAIRDEERRKKEQGDINRMVRGAGQKSGNAAPWSTEKALGFIGAVALVIGVVTLEVAWPWYGWAILFFGGWAGATALFCAFPGVSKLLVRMIQLSALVGCGYLIFRMMRG